MRPITAYISLPAIAHNLRHIQTLHRDKKIAAVLKCNAYGHDACAILPSLVNVPAIAVVEFPLADALRRAGWHKPIVMLEGFFDDDDLAQAYAQNLDLVLHNHWQISRLVDFVPPHVSSAISLWLKMNTGMNRLGLGVTDYRVAYHTLSALPHVRTIVHMTHFANADSSSINSALTPTLKPTLLQQHQLFKEGIKGLAGAISVANSAACFSADYAVCDNDRREEWLRPGIAVYGVSPFVDDPNDVSRSALGLGLQSSHSLQTKVISVQHCNAGDTLGYGSQFVATGPTTIATLAAGYGDGYPRISSPIVGGLEVAIRGQYCPVVGRVSMDMLAVDVSALSKVEIGEAVLLWGHDNVLGSIAVERVAAAAGTIAYDLLCRIHPRVKRIWHDSDTVYT